MSSSIPTKTEIFLIFKLISLDQVIFFNNFLYALIFITTYIVGTPYEGGVFKCKLVVDSEFPQKPPKGTHNFIVHP